MPKFYAQIDASGIPVAGFVLETLASAPSSPTNGRSYYDTALNKARTYQNGQWINFADGQVQSVNGHTGVVVLVKADVGLSNVDNTSDANKPISSATQTALNAKADLASPVFSGSPTAPTPTVATGIANKSYVDMAIQGLSAKSSVRVATTGNIALNGTQTIDGVAVAVGDRVLVKDQSTASQNGIYTAGSAAWSRATDFDSSTEIQSGAYTFVEEGTKNHDSGWVLTTDGTITIGTTSLSFVQFSGAGQISPGPGLSKTGNQLSVAYDNSSIDVDGTGILEVKDLGITEAKLADGVVDLGGAKVSQQLLITNGGTGAASASNARSNLHASGYYTGYFTSLSAGVWTSLPGLTGLLFNPYMSISFIDSPHEHVYFDWKWDATGSGIQVKSDIDVTGTFYYVVTGDL